MHAITNLPTKINNESPSHDYMHQEAGFIMHAITNLPTKINNESPTHMTIYHLYHDQQRSTLKTTISIIMSLYARVILYSHYDAIVPNLKFQLTINQQTQSCTQ